MKMLIKRSLIILAIVLSVNSKAQTTVDLTNLIDSSSVWSHCPPPIPVGLQTMGNVTGYNPTTDSISLHYFWDDGTDTLFKVGIFASTFDYFWSNGVPHIYTSAGIYNVEVIATGPDGTADTMINTPITIYSGCVTVDGYCYTDNNSNCIFDAGDDTLAGIPVVIKDAAGALVGYAYTNTSGYYSTSIPAGLTGLQISPTPWLGAYIGVVCPASGSYTFNSSGSASFNFGLDCTLFGYDLYVSHAYSGVGAPGSNGSVSIYAGGFSCSSGPAIVTLTIDPNVTYAGMNSGPAPTSILGNVLTWNTTISSSLYWGWDFHADVNILTSTSAVFMDTACFNWSISPTAGDISLSNNSGNICLLIGGPYDPNSKQVSPVGIGPAGNIAPSRELTYTVNFQNTGTDVAKNIYVMDTISNNLDMSTFHIVASSHTMNPYFYNGNIIRFDYPNIMLPDSGANQVLSHGWVIYKIKPKTGLANGTQIKNTGHIFFDYNPAIVTNTTLNTIDFSMGINETSNEIGNTIYPNPAQNQVTITFGKTINGTLSVVDMQGRIVKTVRVNETDKVFLDLQDLSSGLYGLMIPGVQLKENRVQIIK